MSRRARIAALAQHRTTWYELLVLIDGLSEDEKRTVLAHVVAHGLKAERPVFGIAAIDRMAWADGMIDAGDRMEMVRLLRRRLNLDDDK